MRNCGIGLSSPKLEKRQRVRFDRGNVVPEDDKRLACAGRRSEWRERRAQRIVVGNANCPAAVLSRIKTTKYAARPIRRGGQPKRLRKTNNRGFLGYARIATSGTEPRGTPMRGARI